MSSFILRYNSFEILQAFFHVTLTKHRNVPVVSYPCIICLALALRYHTNISGWLFSVRDPLFHPPALFANGVQKGFDIKWTW